MAKCIIFLALIVMVAVAHACDLDINIDCSSVDFKYNTCPVRGALTWSTVRVVQKFSNSDCDRGRSYGFRNNAVWVDRGCRAKFNVCSCKQHQVVDCDSNSFKYNECRVPGAHQVTFVELQQRRSKASCNGEYGINGASIYVKDGCRGAFNVCYI